MEFHVAKDNLELLILPAPPPSARITNVCHHIRPLPAFLMENFQVLFIINTCRRHVWIHVEVRRRHSGAGSLPPHGFWD